MSAHSKWRVVFDWLVFGTIALVAGRSQAADVSCGALFQAKKYALSANCFEASARKALAIRPLSTKQGVAAGRLLRNASIGFQKAAAASRAAVRASYYWERAAQAIKLYLARHLYEAKHRKRSAELLWKSLVRKVGYATLSIQAGPQQTVTVLGFHFRARKMGGWEGQLRPGVYECGIKGPMGEQTKRIKIAPRARVFLLLTAPPKAARPAPRRRVAVAAKQPLRPRMRGLRVAGWSLLVLGGAVGVASGVTYGLARNAEIAKLALLVEVGRTPPATLQQSQKLTALHREASTLTPLSSVLLGITGAIVVAGVVCLLFDSRRPTQQPPPPKGRRAPSTGGFGQGDSVLF